MVVVLSLELMDCRNNSNHGGVWQSSVMKGGLCRVELTTGEASKPGAVSAVKRFFETIVPIKQFGHSQQSKFGPFKKKKKKESKFG